MQDLCPEYGAGWRADDLAYLWLWREALRSTTYVDEASGLVVNKASLDIDACSVVLRAMVHIVRLRYFQLRLAEMAGAAGSMAYTDYWHDRRACQHNLAVLFSSREEMQAYDRKLWENTTWRVIQGSIHGAEHETLCVRLGDELVDVILHCSATYERDGLANVSLTLTATTICCAYDVCERRWVSKGTYATETTSHRRSLMSL